MRDDTHESMENWRGEESHIMYVELLTFLKVHEGGKIWERKNIMNQK